jgi:hypothetical protein
MTKEKKIEMIKEEKKKIEILIKKLKQFNENFCLRKKIIKKIKEEINLIKKENTEDNKSDIIDKIINYLGELRLYSVNTVLNFYKVKNVINILFKNNNTIIDLKMLYKLYLYDKDYLLKINDDITFIKDCTVLSDFIEMNNFKGMDTFLLNCSYKIIDNTDKINYKKIIPIDDRMKAEIKKCKYIIKNEKFSLPQNSFSFFISNYLKTPKPQKKLILKLKQNQISNKKLIIVKGDKLNFNTTNESFKNEKNNKKDKTIEKIGFKVEYYLDKLDNLISRIKKDIPIYEISDDIKCLFNKKFEEKIYDKMTYFSGLYPKVITCINKESSTISGICSFYYESIGENNLIIVRINTLYATGD